MEKPKIHQTFFMNENPTSISSIENDGVLQWSATVNVGILNLEGSANSWGHGR